MEIQTGRQRWVLLSGSQVRARRYTRTRLASTGVPGGARRQPRTNVDTKPRAELLRTTVQRACVPRPDHGGPYDRFALQFQRLLTRPRVQFAKLSVSVVRWSIRRCDAFHARNQSQLREVSNRNFEIIRHNRESIFTIIRPPMVSYCLSISAIQYGGLESRAMITRKFHLSRISIESIRVRARASVHVNPSNWNGVLSW